MARKLLSTNSGQNRSPQGYTEEHRSPEFPLCSSVYPVVHQFLISKTDAHRARGTYNFALRIDGFHLTHRVGNGNHAD